MKTKEQVIEWLKSKEWFEQFKVNTEKKFKSFEEVIETYCNGLLFLGCFPWNDTPEGEDFWFNKHNEFLIWLSNENH